MYISVIRQAFYGTSAWKRFIMNIRTAQKILVAATLSLSVVGYPAVAMIARLVGAEDGSLTPMFRVSVVLLSIFAIATTLFTWRISRAASALFIFMMMYLARLILDTTGHSASDPWLLTFFTLTGFIPVTAICFAGRKNVDEALLLKLLLLLGAATVASYYLVMGPTTISAFHGRGGIETLNPISLGQAAVSFAICGVAISLNTSRPLYAMAGLVIIATAMPVIFLAGSKGPILSFAAAVLWMLKFNLRGAVVVASLSAAAYIASEYDEVLMKRFTDMLSGYDPSTAGRITAQEEAMNLFMSAPLFGSSATLSDGGYPHNLFLEVAMSTGIFGLLAISTALLFAVRRISSRRPLSSALFIQYFFAVQFSGAIWSAGYFYCLLAYTLSVSTPRASLLWMRRQRNAELR